MKTPENNSNKRPRKNSKTTPVPPPVSTPTTVPQVPQLPPQLPQGNIPLIEIDSNMMKEILERAANSKSQLIKKYINNQKDAEVLRSIIQEYYTSFILIGYSVDNKRLIIKSTNSDKDEDALLEELRYVCFKLSGG